MWFLYGLFGIDLLILLGVRGAHALARAFKSLKSRSFEISLSWRCRYCPCRHCLHAQDCFSCEFVSPKPLDYYIGEQSGGYSAGYQEFRQ